MAHTENQTPSRRKHKTRRFRPRNQWEQHKPKPPATTVVNISQYQPSHDELELLSLGLTFCPAPVAPTSMELHRDILHFERRVRLKHHFRDSTLPDTMDPFRISSGWTPKAGMNPHLDRYIGNITQDALDFKHRGNPTNLAPQLRNAIHSLRNNSEIIIKPADKGGAIVIWGKDQYVQEAERQLNNPLHYAPQVKDHTSRLTKEINAYLHTCAKSNMIDMDLFRALITTEPRTPCFYMLPKVHKPGNPGRPIVSACGGPTDKISGFIDYTIKTLVPDLQSYIKDTTDFLNKINAVTAPIDCLLATIDVSALYTNIPNVEGISAVRDALIHRPGPYPTPMILRLLHYVLSYNYFEFDNKFYQQIMGCAMGTKCAPNYANLFMGQLELKLQSSAAKKPIVWFFHRRYLHDLDRRPTSI